MNLLKRFKAEGKQALAAGKSVLDHMQTLKLLCVVGYALDAENHPDDRWRQEMNAFLHGLFDDVLEDSGVKDVFPEGGAVRSHERNDPDFSG